MTQHHDATSPSLNHFLIRYSSNIWSTFREFCQETEDLVQIQLSTGKTMKEVGAKVLYREKIDAGNG